MKDSVEASVEAARRLNSGQFNSGQRNSGQSGKGQRSRGPSGRDYLMLVSKTLVFCACLALGAVALQFLPSLSVRGWRIDFLLLASAVIAALVLYFTVGLALLRLLIPRYQERLRLGEKGHAFETPLLALVSDITLHAATLYVYGQDPLSIVLVIVSAAFFAYPFYYLTNTLWSLQPEVLRILSGKTQLRTSSFANVPLALSQKITQAAAAEAATTAGTAGAATAASAVQVAVGAATTEGANPYMPLTICLPVYTEANEVIFRTIRNCLEALSHYQTHSGYPANLLVSDDGLAKLVENDGLTLFIAAESGRELSGQAYSKAHAQAAERLAFYRQHRVSFVARPLAGRAGKFRKSSNLNYTYRLVDCLQQGQHINQLFAADGLFAGGYAEGELALHDIILLLDKDSGLVPEVLLATVPEFAADETLAFTQHATRAQGEAQAQTKASAWGTGRAQANASAQTEGVAQHKAHAQHEPHVQTKSHVQIEGGNYFSWMMERFTSLVYGVALPLKALQGLQVHLMGHNAFLRKRFLEQTGGWAENRVSEDYAKALEGYSAGWHGRYLAFEGLDFTEQVCQSFTEESNKQFRYSYGISEIAPDRRLRLRGAMRTDLLLYYLSFVNLIAALPMVLVLLLLHQIYYLFAGIMVNALIFILVPLFQGWLLGKTIGFRGPLDAPRYFLLNALSYMGYSYSMLRGFGVFLADKLRRTYRPFGVTSVDVVEDKLLTGLRLLGAYVRDNKLALVLFVGVIMGCLQVLADYPAHYIRPLLALFLVSHVIAPVALTPQLFAPVRHLMRQLRQRLPRRLRKTPVVTEEFQAVEDEV